MSTPTQQNSNLDFKGTSKNINLTAGTENGDSVEYGQFQTALGDKQDNHIGGQGISTSGAIINVDLATSGSDYGSLIISGANYSSLNGTYTKLDYSAKLEYIGTDLDLTYGDTEIDWNGYYKDNGAGVWAVVFKRDNDTSEATNPEAGTWLAVLTTTDPTSLSYTGAGSATVASYIPDYQAVNYDFLTSSNESSGDGKFSPSSTDSNVDYPIGSTPAGLIFSNDKLAIDFAQTTGTASSTKVFPSSVVLTEIQEAEARAKDSSNNTFSNAQAGITGNPSNVQSAIEGNATEINTLGTQITALQIVDISHGAHIADNTSALGITQGDDTLPTITGGGIAFVTGTNASARFQSVADSILGIYQNNGLILGLSAFETNFGDDFIILPNDSALKPILQAIEAELQQLAQGLGQFWADGVEVVALSNIDEASAPATIEGVTLTSGDRVLLSAQTSALENGIYVFNGAGSAMTRATDADANAEFTPNKTIQDLATGDTWAYTGDDEPTVGTDSLTFEVKSRAVVADGTIGEVKLTSTLANKINAKVDKYNETINLVSGTEYIVSHNLNTEYPLIQAIGSTGYVENVVKRYIDSNSVGITTYGGNEAMKITIHS